MKIEFGPETDSDAYAPVLRYLKGALVQVRVPVSGDGEHSHTYEGIIREADETHLTIELSTASGDPTGRRQRLDYNDIEAVVYL